MPSVTEAGSPTRARGYKPQGGNRAVPAASEKETYHLIQACKEGDAAAWNALLRRYQPLLFRYAYSLCHNGEDAHDIVGHVLGQLYRNLSRFHEEARFTSWLFSIVRRSYLDLCIRPRYRTELSLDTGMAKDPGRAGGSVIADPARSPETIYMQAASAQELIQAVRYLPASLREVLSLYYIESKSYQEIASEIGVPLGTIKSRINRARHLLRERLEMSAGR
jgi:RNA polymerase sigma-70 factor (ECF subfamily)